MQERIENETFSSPRDGRDAATAPYFFQKRATHSRRQLRIGRRSEQCDSLTRNEQTAHVALPWLRQLSTKMVHESKSGQGGADAI